MDIQELAVTAASLALLVAIYYIKDYLDKKKKVLEEDSVQRKIIDTIAIGVAEVENNIRRNYAPSLSASDKSELEEAALNIAKDAADSDIASRLYGLSPAERTVLVKKAMKEILK
jgi:hypothetical protein